MTNFTVLTPAGSRDLLTVPQMREAVGLSVGDASKDSLLTSMASAAAAAITAHCCVARDGIHAPTLRRETARDVIRLSRAMPRIFLSRRFVSSVTSVVVDGVALSPADYELFASGGSMMRLVNDAESLWCVGKITIEYVAGFQEVPDELRAAAQRLMASMYSDHGRDPSLKREKVDGVGEQEFYVGARGSEFIPLEVQNLLTPFVSRLV